MHLFLFLSQFIYFFYLFTFETQNILMWGNIFWKGTGKKAQIFDSCHIKKPYSRLMHLYFLFLRKRKNRDICLYVYYCTHNTSNGSSNQFRRITVFTETVPDGINFFVRKFGNNLTLFSCHNSSDLEFDADVWHITCKFPKN